MTAREKPLIWAVIALLFTASLLLCLGAKAQTHCDTLEHDRPILDRIIRQQDEQLAERGRSMALLKIRAGISDSIATAIRDEANKRIVLLTQQRDNEQARANRAEADRPKTRIGRIWKDFTTGLQIAIPALALGFVVGSLR